MRRLRWWTDTNWIQIWLQLCQWPVPVWNVNWQSTVSDFNLVQVKPCVNPCHCKYKLLSRFYAPLIYFFIKFLPILEVNKKFGRHFCFPYLEIDEEIERHDDKNLLNWVLKGHSVAEIENLFIFKTYSFIIKM